MATPNYTIDQSKQTVQGQLNNVLNQNNPLMQKAKSQGQQYANKRGLLNSSIGAGATQSAMMDYAMPIAQADADTNNKFAMAKYGNQLTQSNMNLETDNRLRIQDDAQAFTKGENALDRSQQRYMQDDQQSFIYGQNALDRSQQRFMQDDQQAFAGQQNSLDRSQQRWMQDDSQAFSRSENALDRNQRLTEMSRENTYRQQQMQKEADLNLEQTALTTTANLQGKYLDAMDNIKQEYQTSINEIEIAENITPAEKTKMINNTIARRNADYTFTSQLYSKMPGWDYSWIDIANGRMPNAPTITPR